MAQKIQTLFTGDLDGSPADGTVRSGPDGTGCEIDLNKEHAQALRSALARYVAAARRGPALRTRPGAAQGRRRRPEHHRGPGLGQGAGHRGERPRPDTRRAHREVQGGDRQAEPAPGSCRNHQSSCRQHHQGNRTTMGLRWESCLAGQEKRRSFVIGRRCGPRSWLEGAVLQASPIHALTWTNVRSFLGSPGIIRAIRWVLKIKGGGDHTHDPAASGTREFTIDRGARCLSRISSNSSRGLASRVASDERARRGGHFAMGHQTNGRAARSSPAIMVA